MQQSTLDAYQRTVHNCPSCEETFDSETGMKIHHARVHGESLAAKVTHTCNQCGDTFDRNPSQAGECCSIECKAEYRKENGLPARRRRVEKTCPTCGEEFTRPLSQKDRAFCSHECWSEQTDSETFECEYCGSEFRRYGRKTETARFCSKSCHGLAKRITDGSDLRSHYGPGWNEGKREDVRDRDGCECADCGLSEKEHTEIHGTKLHVHHTVNPRKSTNPAVHNARRNLVTLCNRCHRIRENHRFHRDSETGRYTGTGGA